MGRADYLALGDWNVVCAICGRKRKASMLTKNWQGFYACPEHNPPRQPQDFVRGVPDDPAAPWAQDPADAIVRVCTPNGLSAIPGYAMPGCMVPGYLSPAFNPEGDPLG